jgi:hypothetical protein
MANGKNEEARKIGLEIYFDDNVMAYIYGNQYTITLHIFSGKEGINYELIVAPYFLDRWNEIYRVWPLFAKTILHRMLAYKVTAVQRAMNTHGRFGKTMLGYNLPKTFKMERYLTPHTITLISLWLPAFMGLSYPYEQHTDDYFKRFIAEDSKLNLSIETAKTIDEAYQRRLNAGTDNSSSPVISNSIITNFVAGLGREAIEGLIYGKNGADRPFGFHTSEGWAEARSSGLVDFADYMEDLLLHRVAIYNHPGDYLSYLRALAGKAFYNTGISRYLEDIKESDISEQEKVKLFADFFAVLRDEALKQYNYQEFLNHESKRVDIKLNKVGYVIGSLLGNSARNLERPVNILFLGPTASLKSTTIREISQVLAGLRLSIGLADHAEAGYALGIEPFRFSYFDKKHSAKDIVIAEAVNMLPRDVELLDAYFMLDSDRSVREERVIRHTGSYEYAKERISTDASEGYSNMPAAVTLNTNSIGDDFIQSGHLREALANGLMLGIKVGSSSPVEKTDAGNTNIPALPVESTVAAVNTIAAAKENTLLNDGLVSEIAREEALSAAAKKEYVDDIFRDGLIEMQGFGSAMNSIAPPKVSLFASKIGAFKAMETINQGGKNEYRNKVEVLEVSGRVEELGNTVSDTRDGTKKAGTGVSAVVSGYAGRDGTGLIPAGKIELAATVLFGSIYNRINSTLREAGLYIKWATGPPAFNYASINRRLLTRPYTVLPVAGETVMAIVVSGGVVIPDTSLGTTLTTLPEQHQEGGVPCVKLTSIFSILNTLWNLRKTPPSSLQPVITVTDTLGYSFTTRQPVTSTPVMAAQTAGKRFLGRTSRPSLPASSPLVTTTSRFTGSTAPIIKLGQGAVVSPASGANVITMSSSSPVGKSEISRKSIAQILDGDLVLTSRYLFKNETELDKLRLFDKLFDKSSKIVKRSNLIYNHRKYLYRGMRLKPDSLDVLMQGGLRAKNSMYGSNSAHTSPFLPLMFAFWPSAVSPIKCPKEDFLSVIFQIDITRNPGWGRGTRGPGFYDANRDIPPEWIFKVFVFNKESLVFEDMKSLFNRHSITSSPVKVHLKNGVIYALKVSAVAGLMGLSGYFIQAVYGGAAVFISGNIIGLAGVVLIAGVFLAIRWGMYKKGISSFSAKPGDPLYEQVEAKIKEKYGEDYAKVSKLVKRVVVKLTTLVTDDQRKTLSFSPTGLIERLAKSKKDNRIVNASKRIHEFYTKQNKTLLERGVSLVISAISLILDFTLILYTFLIKHPLVYMELAVNSYASRITDEQVLKAIEEAHAEIERSTVKKSLSLVKDTVTLKVISDFASNEIVYWGYKANNAKSILGKAAYMVPLGLSVFTGAFFSLLRQRLLIYLVSQYIAGYLLGLLPVALKPYLHATLFNFPIHFVEDLKVTLSLIIHSFIIVFFLDIASLAKAWRETIKKEGKSGKVLRGLFRYSLVTLGKGTVSMMLVGPEINLALHLTNGIPVVGDTVKFMEEFVYGANGREGLGQMVVGGIEGVVAKHTGVNPHKEIFNFISRHNPLWNSPDYDTNLRLDQEAIMDSDIKKLESKQNRTSDEDITLKNLKRQKIGLEHGVLVEQLVKSAQELAVTEDAGKVAELKAKVADLKTKITAKEEERTKEGELTTQEKEAQDKKINDRISELKKLAQEPVSLGWFSRNFGSRAKELNG